MKYFLFFIITFSAFGIEILDSEASEILKLLIESNKNQGINVRLDIKGDPESVISFREQLLKQTTRFNYKVYIIESEYLVSNGLKRDGVYIEYPHNIPVITESIVFTNSKENFERVTFSFFIDDGNLKILGNIKDIEKKNLKLESSIFSLITLRRPK